LFKKELWARISKLCSVNSYPNLPCPYCGLYNLELDKETFQNRKLSGAALEAYREKFRPVSIDETSRDGNSLGSFFAMLLLATDFAMNEIHQFIAFFECSMCKESVSSIGIAKISSNSEKKWFEIKVESFNPPLPLFPLVETTPNSVNEELLSSFNHFHSDISAAGNRMRRAIEKLCQELNATGSNLHRKIQELSKEYPREANWLESLKLVGNEATHSDRVEEEDLLNSYQIFEVVLDIFRRNFIEPKMNDTATIIRKKFNNEN